MNLVTDNRCFSVYIKYARGFSVARIAKEVGRSERTIKRWLMRAAETMSADISYICKCDHFTALTLALSCQRMQEDFRLAIVKAISGRKAGLSDFDLVQIFGVPQDILELTKQIESLKKEK